MSKTKAFMFDDFREEKKGNSKLHERIAEYERVVRSLKGKSLRDLPLYDSYLSTFEILDFRKPEMEKAFPYDWNHFVQLAAASFSCASSLTLSTNRDQSLPDLHLSVSSNKEEHKVLAHLSFFQVERLFFIFVDEILALEIQAIQDPGYKSEIQDIRQKKIVEWNMGLSQFKPLLLLRQRFQL